MTSMHQILLNQHKTYLAGHYDQNTTSEVTEWVERELIQRSDISAHSKLAFYEAEKSLLCDFIKANDLEAIVCIVHAIDHSSFAARYGKLNENLNKFRCNQCVVLSKAIIETESHLENDKYLHKPLGRLLFNRYKTQKELDSSYWKMLLQEKVPRALRIVCFRAPGLTDQVPTQSASVRQASKRRLESSARVELHQPGPSDATASKRAQSASEMVGVAFSSEMSVSESQAMEADTAEINDAVAIEGAEQQEADEAAAAELVHGIQDVELEVEDAKQLENEEIIAEADNEGAAQ